MATGTGITVVTVGNAWEAGVAFSQCIRCEAGPLLFLSGQVALDAEGRLVGRGDLELQTRTTFGNIRSLLTAAGSTMEHVLKLTYFVRDMSEWPVVQRVRAEFFPRHHPASTTVEVSRLHNEDYLIEIEAVAGVPCSGRRRFRAARPCPATTVGKGISMSSTAITRRKLGRAVAGGVAVLAAPAILRRAAAREAPRISVRMGYTWASSQYYAVYLMGREKGFFAEAGADPTFVEGTGSGTGVQLIASGKADLGAAIATGAVINAVSRGAKVRMVAATLPSNPIAVISRQNAALKTPHDLIGKTIGIPPGTEQEQLWPAFLHVNKLAPSSIKVVSVTGDALPAALGLSRLDGYVSYSTDLPFLEKSGLHVATMLFSDFGIVYAPGEGIVASREMLDRKPDIVRAFLVGLERTFTYGLAHPDEAAAAGARAFPDQMQDQVALGTLKIMGALNRTAIKGGSVLDLFRMSDRQWQGTLDLLTKFGGLKHAAPASEYYTNAFLPKA